MNTSTPPICGLQILWHREMGQINLEQYVNSDPDDDFKEILAVVDLEYSKKELDQFFGDLSEKTDDYTGEITPEYVEEVRSLIGRRMNKQITFEAG